MSVLENLEIGANLRRDDKEAVEGDIERVMTLFPRLKERVKQKAGTLSGGEQQMLAIGRALLADPTVLLMDEPSMGLAPILVEQVFETIQEINGQGTTVFLVEQNAHVALSIAEPGLRAPDRRDRHVRPGRHPPRRPPPQPGLPGRTARRIGSRPPVPSPRTGETDPPRSGG